MSFAGNLVSPSGSARRRRILAGAIVIAAAFGGVACGDDADDAATPATPAGPSTTAESEFAAYCEATFKAEEYFAEDPDVDFETATPAQIQAATQAYLQGAKPLIDALVPLVPAEIKAPTDVLLGVFNQALAGTVNPDEAFDTPEVKAAETQTHAFDLKNCGWGKAEVSGTEYSFSQPGQLKAGRTSIDFTNKGKELHQLILFAKNPGVTETFDEILALPEEEARTKVRPVAGAFAEQNESDYVVTDLAQGSYLAVCFLPQGFVSTDGPPPENAPPHFALGMKLEITVA